MSHFLNVKDKRLARFDHFVCHCTATPPGVHVDDEWLDHLHGDIRGWSNRTGYHVLIGRDGTVYTKDRGHKMRDFKLAGAHVGNVGKGWNSRSFGVVLAGGVDNDNRPVNNFTEAQWASLEEVCVGFLKAHPDPYNVSEAGHKDLLREHGGPPKACPCFDFRGWWAEQDIEGQAGLDDREDLDNFETNGVDEYLVHVVVRGDTVSRIARRHGTTVAGIQKINPDLEVRTIFPGQEIKIP
jgi:N-acetylmuramoyl-L-alanine amidase